MIHNRLCGELTRMTQSHFNTQRFDLAKHHRDFTVTFHVIVEKQAVVHGDEAEAGVVALFRYVARGQTGVGQRSKRAAVTLGPLERLDVPRQTRSFTCKTEAWAAAKCYFHIFRFLESRIKLIELNESREQ